MSKQPPAGLEALKLAARFIAGKPADMLHITSDLRRAAQLHEVLRQCLPDVAVELLPPWDVSPGDTYPPSPQAMGERMAVLHRLGLRKGPRILIASVRAILQRTPVPGSIESHAMQAGDRLDENALRDYCHRNGYFIDERIDEPGEVAFRGQIVDIYPGGCEWPCRIEAIDGRVHEIKPYDPLTQRSFDTIAELVLTPVVETPGEASLFDHVPQARVTIWEVVNDALAQLFEQIGSARPAQRGGSGKSPAPEGHYLSRKDWAQIIGRRNAETVSAGAWQEAPAIIAERRTGAALKGFAAKQAEQARRVIVAATGDGEIARINAMLRKATGSEPVEAGLPQVLAGEQEGVPALKADFNRGFISEDLRLAVLTPRELTGTRQQMSRRRQARQVSNLAPDFQLGDLVVHEDHGIGILEDLEQVDGEEGRAEFVRLGYAEGQKLLAPVEQAGKLWRYGPEDAGMALDRLDNGSWEKRRHKVLAAVEKAARLTLDAARRRLAAQAPVLTPPQAIYERFAAGFGFDETPDQDEAIRATLDDLQSGRPMDRLVIGDVGFGKTEVALRAAAASAFAGKQVAVIAPTTLLARQHFATFQRRFEGMENAIAHLSRLVSRNEAQAVREGLASGAVRIVVATHSILGKDVSFADLALVVIDEEQRFGAAQKRKLREMSEGLHVLTMSATPIPQTLQSALAGLRDISLINTAPAARRPVRTIVEGFDAGIAGQALVREQRRGGRSFVIVPRIEEMAQAAEKLKRSAPGLKLLSLHAKMPARQIDETMIAFAQGEGDVLLSTSIVESGLDIPRADTMVVLRPSLFGVTQLHQLRGRVGRGGRQAYCYLLTMPDENLGEAAKRRLGTLEQFDRLGAGMAVANADMRQRGGGEVLGLDQSGHADLIGLDLLQELVAKALRTARGEAAPMPEVELQIGGGGLLPQEYIPQAELRFGIYRRLAKAADRAEIDDLREEIADRFGPLPRPVELLLDRHLVRVMAGALDISAIAAGPQAIALEFASGQTPDVEADADLYWKGGRLICKRAGADASGRLEAVLELLSELG